MDRHPFHTVSKGNKRPARIGGAFCLPCNLTGSGKQDTSRKGLRQLSAMKELKMGSDQYELVSMD